MNLRPEEISSVIKEEIKKYSTEFEVSDVGTVIQVAVGLQCTGTAHRRQGTDPHDEGPPGRESGKWCYFP